MLAREPKAEALDAEWKKVEAAWAKHIAPAQVAVRGGRAARRSAPGRRCPRPTDAPSPPGAFPVRGRAPRASGSTRVLEAGRPGKDHLLDSAGAGAAFLDLRQGRPARRLPRERLAPGRRARRRARPQRALPPARGRHLRGRHRSRRCRRRGAVGIGRVRRRLRQRRLARHPGHELRTQRPLSQPRRRALRERGRARRASSRPGWNTGAAFFDADGDGWLDLYVAQLHRLHARRRAARRSARSRGAASRRSPSARSASRARPTTSSATRRAASWTPRKRPA